MTGRQSPAQPIISRCRELGFAIAGITPAAPSAWADHMQRWLENGRHGSMSYLADAIQTRLDARIFVPECRSLILVADQYATRADPPELHERLHGRIARYARGRDYHQFMKRRLHSLCDDLRPAHPGHTFRAFVDTAPVLEREHASRAGLGWIGKHTLLIHPRLGSYMLLGGIATTLDIEAPPEQEPVEDACGACTRCIDACPTRAISPYSVDASRCISYLTIEHEDPVEPHLAAGISDRLFGCDICQEVCPHNSARPSGSDTGTVLPAYAPRRRSLPIVDVLTWDENARRETFRSSPMKRAGLAMMKRNALIVAGNELRLREDQTLRQRVADVLADESESDLVRGAARWAMGQNPAP